MNNQLMTEMVAHALHQERVREAEAAARASQVATVPWLAALLIGSGRALERAGKRLAGGDGLTILGGAR